MELYVAHEATLFTHFFPINADPPPPPPPPTVVTVTPQLPAKDPVNTTPEFVLSRTPHVTLCDAENAFGALHIRVLDPVHVAFASPAPQETLYSRLATLPTNPAALQVYVIAAFG